MKLYDCTVCLCCENNNQVPMTQVTAAEIKVLQAIHGGAKSAGGAVPVINIRPSLGEDKHQLDADRTENEERDRLIALYLGDGTTVETRERVMAVLGPVRVSLTADLPATQLSTFEPTQDVAFDAPAARKTLSLPQKSATA